MLHQGAVPWPSAALQRHCLCLCHPCQGKGCCTRDPNTKTPGHGKTGFLSLWRIKQCKDKVTCNHQRYLCPTEPSLPPLPGWRDHTPIWLMAGVLGTGPARVLGPSLLPPSPQRGAHLLLRLPHLKAIIPPVFKIETLLSFHPFIPSISPLLAPLCSLSISKISMKSCLLAL